MKGQRDLAREGEGKQPNHAAASLTISVISLTAANRYPRIGLWVLLIIGWGRLDLLFGLIKNQPIFVVARHNL